MARNDIYRLRHTDGLVLDVQGLEESSITSRVVIPLLPTEQNQHKVVTRIHPIIDLGGRRYVMATHLMASVSGKEIGQLVRATNPG